MRIHCAPRQVCSNSMLSVACVAAKTYRQGIHFTMNKTIVWSSSIPPLWKTLRGPSSVFSSLLFLPMYCIAIVLHKWKFGSCSCSSSDSCSLLSYFSTYVPLCMMLTKLGCATPRSLLRNSSVLCRQNQISPNTTFHDYYAMFLMLCMVNEVLRAPLQDTKYFWLQPHQFMLSYFSWGIECVFSPVMCDGKQLLKQ